MYLAVSGFMPTGRLLLITGVIAGSIAAEGLGQVSGLLLALSLAQSVFYLFVSWLLAFGLARALARHAPRQAMRLVLAALTLAIVWTSALDVFHTPFNLGSLHTSLLGVYRPPHSHLTDGRSAIDPVRAANSAGEREPCDDRNPLRNAYFGDTHVHTALSFDAMGQGTRNRPRDAYRFARGEELGIQPYDASGRPWQTVSLRRPLDFAMVSDHAELLGETHICFAPSDPGYDSTICRLVRGWPRLGYMIVNGDTYAEDPPVRYSFCGEEGEHCRLGALEPWIEIQRAAEEAYDRSSSCEFTSFVGFEWTGMPGGNNTHRNIVFRNRVVPELPINYLDTPTEEGLWDDLHRLCLDRENGCDALAIPHNSNVSNGQLFRIQTADGRPIDRANALRRAKLEVLVEVTQHKGDSECRRPGAPTADELCGFETPAGSTMTEMMAPFIAKEPAPLSYVREVLAEGVAQAARIGANPFKLGLIGSTDTHFGTPGMVDEDRFVGHAAGTTSRLVEAPVMPDHLVLNPGGLAVLWAEENSREALFAAMRRREVYGTSGPRMLTRFFGGWELPEDLCGRPDFVEAGYARGVAMGGDLPALSTSAAPNADPAAPRFAVWALKDPGTSDFPGTDLQRIQIVKAWEEAGVTHERVYEVAGDPNNGAGVDPTSCARIGAGFDDLCAVWRDPDFEPERHAVYYARVVENPSCRWNSFVCISQAVDCSDSGSVSRELAPCCDPEVPKTIQERAWTSPIWYTPTSAAPTAG